MAADPRAEESGRSRDTGEPSSPSAADLTSDAAAADSDLTAEQVVPSAAARPAATTVLPHQPGRATADRDAEAEADEGGRGSFLRELPVLVVIALLLAVVIKAFLLQAFYIPSGSMEQTLKIGDRVLVNKLVYRFRDIHRGEVVVFDGRESSFQPEYVLPEPSNAAETVLQGIRGTLGLGATGERDFIKRVIGLPGDEVQCCDEQGRVSVNGVALDEDYLYEDNRQTFGPVTVPEGRIFVLGDHRGSSQDSRAYVGQPDSGTVSLDRVIGRAFVIVWPTESLGVLSQPDTFTAAPDAPAEPPTATTPTAAAAPAGAELVLAGGPLLLGAVAAVPLHRTGRRVVRRAARRVRR